MVFLIGVMAQGLQRAVRSAPFDEEEYGGDMSAEEPLDL